MNATFRIETFGCQMNKNDSELMDLSMREQGFIPAEDAENANIIIFNTCSVRQHAEQRVIARLESIRASRAMSGGKIRLVSVAGCMAQRIGPELIERNLADMVVGTYHTPRIGMLVRERLLNGAAREILSMSREDFAQRITPGLIPHEGSPPWHRWVTISHGCDNDCSYCIVPRVRGTLLSFPSRMIMDHVRALAQCGTREVTLLGQNVNQYGADGGDIPFYRLLAMTAEVPGIERVNFLTSHPRDFNAAILDVMRDHPNISRSIHLPLQSGSDRILSLMNRHYTMADYMRIVDAIARSFDSYTLTTDLIVGFPSETEEEFMATMDAVSSIRFDEAFTYAYSPRPGTPACDMREEIPRKEKMDRLRRLIDRQRVVSAERLKEQIGRVEVAIIERTSKKSSSKVMGRSFLNHIVVVPGTAEDIGKTLRIRIEGVAGMTLQGKRIA